MGLPPGWVLKNAVSLGGSCAPEEVEFCGALDLNELTSFTIKANFKPEPKHWALNRSTSGTGSGTFECEVNGGPKEACKAEYVENDSVKVITKAPTGSKFVEFNSENGGECSGATCTVTSVETAKHVNAEFNLESEAFTPTVEGEGNLQCKDNGGGLTACAGSYLWGHTIEVVATANPENSLKEISGLGSASACVASPCTFVIKAASSVKAKFVSNKIRSVQEPEVKGNVPQTTTLGSTCTIVDLEEFIPGSNANYHKTCGLTLTTTGEETTLTATDKSAIDTGHLVNNESGGPWELPSALEAGATATEGSPVMSGLKPLSPVTLLTFKVPVSNDAATLEFNQKIGAHDGLRTGKYSKTITLTLEQTKP